MEQGMVESLCQTPPPYDYIEREEEDINYFTQTQVEYLKSTAQLELLQTHENALADSEVDSPGSHQSRKSSVSLLNNFVMHDEPTVKK